MKKIQRFFGRMDKNFEQAVPEQWEQIERRVIKPQAVPVRHKNSRYLALAASAAAIAVVAMTVWWRQQNRLPALPPGGGAATGTTVAASGTTASAPATPTVPSTSSERTAPTNATTAHDQTATDRIVFNAVEPKSSPTLYRDPSAQPRKMDFQQFRAYIGFDPTPSYLPAGFSAVRSGRDEQTLYFMPDGLPAPAHNWYSISYENAEKDQTICIRVGRSVYENRDTPVGSARVISKIDETDVLLCKAVGYDRPYYSASFRVDGVGFYVFTIGDELLPEEEFVKVVRSLIK